MGYIVVLIGGIGSGKSMVVDVFVQFGVKVIDVDVIVCQVVEFGILVFQVIVGYFGLQMIVFDGMLNCCLLWEKIFVYVEEKVWFNVLLYLLIQQEMCCQMQVVIFFYFFWVVFLLVENCLFGQVDCVLVVDVLKEM